MPEQITLTVQQLYELAWTKPISQLARELSISDVGLSKLCARYGIPTPPRGYWARQKAGTAPKRTTLRSTPEHESTTLSFSVSAFAARAKERESDSEDQIIVGDNLDAPCSLVKLTQAHLRGTKPDNDGLLRCSKPCLNLSVSPAELPLSLRIYDALLKACETRGWKASVTDEHTVVEVGDVSVKVSLEEGLHSVELPIEPDLTGRYSFHYKRRGEMVRRPAGQLAIRIEEPIRIWNQQLRRCWQGSEKRPLELQLRKVVHGMLRLAEAVRGERERVASLARRREDDERSRQRAQEELQRLRDSIAKEKRALEALRSSAARWNESQLLRSFIARAREHASLPEMNLGGAELTTWCEWAELHAQRLDPFVVSPPSVLDDEERVEQRTDPVRRGW